MAHAFTSSSTVHPLLGIAVVVVLVVIAYRSHLIERTEESFIHLIWPEIFLLSNFFFFIFSSFLYSIFTIAIVARWEKSVQLSKHSVHRGMYFVLSKVARYHLSWQKFCSAVAVSHSVCIRLVAHVYIRCTLFCSQSTATSTDIPSAFFNLFRPRLAPIGNHKTDRKLPSFHESRSAMHTGIHL